MLDFLTLSDVIIDTETLEKPESPQVPARIGIVCSQKTKNYLSNDHKIEVFRSRRQ